MEIDIWDSKEGHYDCQGKYQMLAPIRILSFDIECLPDKDQTIQLGNIVHVHGQGEDPIIRNIFTLNSCAPIAGTKVFPFKIEEEMLVAWREFVRLCDPDIVTGYNITNFDWTYIVGRGDAL